MNENESVVENQEEISQVQENNAIVIKTNMSDIVISVFGR